MGMTSKMRCIHLVECYTISAIPTPTPEMLIVMLENNSTQMLYNSTINSQLITLCLSSLLFGSTLELHIAS